ncbi:DUF2029 domain-containing protein [bacterium]|nr:DUF2029 domain-containing protein [bacterium]
MDILREYKYTAAAWTIILILGILGWIIHPKAGEFLFSFADKGGGYDFFHYYASVQALNEGSINIYSTEDMKAYSGALSQGRWQIFDNHPLPFYLFFLPFAAMNFFTAFAVYDILQYLAAAAGIFILCSELLKKQNQTVIYVTAALLSLSILSWGVCLDSLWLGQVGGFFWLSLALCWKADENGWDWLTGLTLSAAVLLKLYPVILLAWLLCGRKYKAAGYFMLFITVFSVVSGALWGFSRFGDYLSYMANEQVYPNAISNQSLMAALSAALYDMPPAVIKFLNLILLAAAGYGIALLTGPVRPEQTENDGNGRIIRALTFSLWLFASLVLSPISWGHHHIILLLPLLTSLSMLIVKESFSAVKNLNYSLYASIFIAFILFCLDGESFYGSGLRSAVIFLFAHKAVLILMILWTASSAVMLSQIKRASALSTAETPEKSQQK